ncbi:phosphatidylserine decarboxylase [Flavicella sp.]|uniref:phosphatidylserine decarboxylase n=1 Tax=Flavicella sp. TaxID=2957742 RepID=UPI003019B446
MNQLLTQTENTQESISFIFDNVSETDWKYIEQSLDLADAKAALYLNNNLYNALDWPLCREDYIIYLKKYQKWIPQQTSNEKWNLSDSFDCHEANDRLCHFYFLIDQQTEIGSLREKIPWFTEFLINFTESWGKFLNTKESISKKILASFLKNSIHPSKADVFIESELELPWNSFNHYYAWEMNPLLRPIDDQDNNLIITAPTDCTFKKTYKIDNNSFIDEISFKQTHQFSNIKNFLKGSKYADSFTNGTCIHYKLGPYSYHHFHSPVSGLVKESYPVYGLRYKDIGIDDSGQFYKTENISKGYQFSQARGILILDTRNSPNGDMGLVAVVPVGMCQIASVHLLATPDTVLEKGEEFGYFKFGGSDVVLIFQEGKAPKIDESTHKRFYGSSIS